MCQVMNASVPSGDAGYHACNGARPVLYVQVTRGSC